jgi:hypothetical protein
MVTSQLLAQMRATAAQFLTDTCTVEREAQRVDRHGAPAHTWETVAEAVPCRLIDPDRERPSSGAAQTGGQETIVETYRLCVPAGTGLAPDYRVTVNGATYHVTRLVTRRSDAVDAQAIITRRRGA